MNSEQYLSALVKRDKTPPLFEKEGQAEDLFRAQAEHFFGVLCRANIEFTVVGGTSVFLQTRYDGTYIPHDIDIAVRKDQVSVLLQVLKRERYATWDENTIHQSARNLSGGFGRHHELGASHPQYKNNFGLPFWLGIFTYEPSAPTTIFREQYAVSEYKIFLAISELLTKHPDKEVRVFLSRYCRPNLTDADVIALFEFCDARGISVIDALFSPDVNHRDVQRRNELDHDAAENFYAFEYMQEYDCTPEQYFGNDHAVVSGQAVRALPLENTLLRVSKHFPHYLGRREKYVAAAKRIREGSTLDAEKLQFYSNIYERRKVSHRFIGRQRFLSDRMKDASLLQEELTLRGQVKDADPLYWALLLEDVHFTTK